MGKYALLIGVGEYGEGLQPLPAAVNDVAALKGVLEDPEMGGFDQVKAITNPTRGEMEREIELWFLGRQKNDLILLFFSGHGIKDEMSRDLYFASCNTEKQRDFLVRSTATSALFINDCICRCKAQYQVIILDCCFSGAFGELVPRDAGDVNLQNQLGAEGRVVLTSTNAVDYSFEEKGHNLSIYTRFLVEGIATGAADSDGDGIITAEELHQYAGRKVQEASPAMSPKIFIPQGEGYRIRLARSPQGDPKLKYRQEAEKRANSSEFSIAAKTLLIDFRSEFGISEREAEAIEAEVLKPYREYEQKRSHYQNTLRKCLEKEKPLKLSTIQDLRDLQAHLQLQLTDLLVIEQQELQGHDLESYAAEIERQQQAVEADMRQRLQEREARERQQREERERQRQLEAEANQRQADSLKSYQKDDDDLSSERFGAGYYDRLRDLLVAQDWKAADQETADRMREVMDRSQEEPWLREEDAENFPSLDLRNIDSLWVKYSSGKFGFSVQKEIWKTHGSRRYNEDWEKFATEVGWHTKGSFWGGGKWLFSYSELILDLTAPKGELPWIWWACADAEESLQSLLSRPDL